MTGIYKSGVRVATKASTPANVEFAAAFAAQIICALERHAKVLRALKANDSVPNRLYGPIQDLFGIAVKASIQYSNSLKHLTGRHLKQTQDLTRATIAFELLFTDNTFKQEPTSKRLLVVLRSLTAHTRHFVRQIELTHHSFRPGARPNIRPVNWSLRCHVLVHIEEHQAKYGLGIYPNLNAAQIRARKEGHRLSDRTYRALKNMHKRGTLLHYTQPKSGSK